MTKQHSIFVGANSQQFDILMSRFNKDFDNGLQNTQGTLCSGIYATSMVADKFNDLKKSNPEDEIINDLIANFIWGHNIFLSQASFLKSLSRREHLKHLFQGDYKDLCKTSLEVTDELFCSELSKACKDIRGFLGYFNM